MVTFLCALIIYNNQNSNLNQKLKVANNDCFRSTFASYLMQGMLIGPSEAKYCQSHKTPKRHKEKKTHHRDMDLQHPPNWVAVLKELLVF